MAVREARQIVHPAFAGKTAHRAEQVAMQFDLGQRPHELFERERAGVLLVVVVEGHETQISGEGRGH